MATPPVIDVTNLSFRYDGQSVLEDVNLAIGEQDFVCIVGPNGGGKTTLLKLMLGLLSPTRGQVRVFGRPPQAVRSRMGYMPQHAHLDPAFPVQVMDVVLMGRLPRRRRPATGRPDRAVAEEALREVEMYDLRHRPFAALSGGQRQRVLIARALAAEPDLLLLDEPMANLDVEVETTLSDLLVAFSRRMTVVTVSHDLGFVSQFVRTVVCVNRTVVVHPTSDLTGAAIQSLYGGDMRLVRHDHRCSEKGHAWTAS